MAQGGRPELSSLTWFLSHFHLLCIVFDTGVAAVPLKPDSQINTIRGSSWKGQ